MFNRVRNALGRTARGAVNVARRVFNAVTGRGGKRGARRSSGKTSTDPS